MFIGYCKRHIRNTMLRYKVKYCGKVLKNHVTHRQNGTLYFLIMVVRVS